MKEVLEESSICELNEEFRDEQGILYTLCEEDKTAIVGTDDTTENNAGLKQEKKILNIPAQVRKDDVIYTVTRIGANSFSSNRFTIGCLKMADTIKSIGDKAFHYSHLEKIVIGKNVSEIGKSVFTTIYLKNIFVHSDNTNFVVYHDILFDASMETLIRFPIYGVGEDADVSLPSSVKTIAEGAFYCSFVGYIHADSVTQIKNNAFFDSNIKGFSGKNVKEIEEKGFYRCEELTYLYLGEHLESIGKNAFYQCEELETVLLPDSVKTIGERAFTWSPKLKYVLGASHARYEAGIVSWCENLTFMELSDAMDTIADSQFSGCKKLEKLYLPDNYTAIHPWASIQEAACLYALPEQEAFIKKARVNFCSLSNHAHILDTQILQEPSKTLKGITLTYCMECHYVQSASFIAETTSVIPTLMPDYKPVVRTPKPVETATPEPEETVTPPPDETVTPKPEFPVETIVPTPEETVTPVPSETLVPSAAPSGGSSGSSGSSGGSEAAGGGSSGGGGASGGGGGITAMTPSPSPALPFVPAATPSPSPLLPLVPDVTPSPTPDPVISSDPGIHPGQGGSRCERRQIAKTNFVSLKLNSYNQPVLRWKKNSSADGYLVYRSLKRNGGYRLISTAKRNTVQFTDKKALTGKRYYYRICAFRNYGKLKYCGSYSSVRNIRLYSLSRPKFTAKKGVTVNRIYYIQIRLQKYSGTNVALYLKRGKGYSRIQLKSSSIRKYNGSFKLQCNRRHKVYYLKARTYIRRKGKIYYSPSSKVVKVRV